MQPTVMVWPGCCTYRFIISGLSVQMPTTGSVTSRSSAARRSSCQITTSSLSRTARAIRSGVTSRSGSFDCPFPAQMDDLGAGTGGGYEWVFADANENRDGKARMLPPGSGEVADRIVVE